MMGRQRPRYYSLAEAAQRCKVPLALLLVWIEQGLISGSTTISGATVLTDETLVMLRRLLGLD